ncbi:hypothetical protein NKDENANG_01703 [Candidatus Entotheonellaceae bacterium PAL068K]
MLAKKFALGFALALILPMMVYYGVSSVSPPPDWEQYMIENYHERHERASAEEQQQMEAQKSELNAKLREDSRRFQQHLFFTAVPVGVLAIVIGVFLPVPTVGTGLMFGGILNVCVGYSWYWRELSAVSRFLSLLIAFMILIFVGYKKIERTRNNSV